MNNAIFLAKARKKCFCPTLEMPLSFLYLLNKSDVYKPFT